jgi:hypothetical protein
MTDLNDFIRKYMPKSDSFFSVEPLEECADVDWEVAQGPQWEPRDDTYIPRAVPPERKPKAKVPMAHDGGPGVKDHSLIKSVLRRSGML